MSAERVASMPEDDWRKRNAEFLGDRLAHNLSLAERVGAVADRHGTSKAAVAVAWVLAWPGVTGAIVGARRPEQLDDWGAAANLSLGDEDLAELARALEETGAGAGPLCPAPATKLPRTENRL
jgi:aryl-alcohol dehydrogenase-like predicted oxidoreductase